jgi:hypothetical protein
MADKVTVLTDELRATLAPELKALEDAAFNKGKDEGAKTERERIQGIENAAIDGHDELVKEMKFDGKTSPAEAASRILAAEKQKKTERLAAIRTSGPAAVPAAPVTEVPPKAAEDKTKDADLGEKLAKEARDYQAEQKNKGIDISNAEAVRFVYQRAGVPLK